jgi:hypothetical protein
MKKVIFIVLAIMGGMILNSAEKSDSPPVPNSTELSSGGTTYYVRTDGGTSTQCTGLVDAPYPGSGTNQPCAWSHPYWALDNEGDWRIQGGDTIIVGPGSYMMGYGAPNTGWCDPDGAYECDIPPLPSGPDQNHPTRIVGKGWDTGCTNPPELWGTQRIWHVLDLTDTSNAVISCFEITDHSGCVEFHSNPEVECERDNYPFGQWASSGITASDSSNVTLSHLNIHGLASHGIAAGRISNWTVDDVRIAGNGWVGWEGDIDGEDTNSGTLHFKNWIVEWNGCGETYPGEQPHNCWGQSAGGYGDGVGTGRTGGNWVIEDSIFRYNTSDGLDLLYVRESGSSIRIERSMSYGNAGDQMKVNGDTAIENCLVVSNCGYFDGKSFTWDVDHCRAGGSGLALNLRKGNTISVINSTISGQGDCLAIVECDDSACDGSEEVIVQNNIFIGNPDFTSPGDTTCYFWFDRDDFYRTRMDYNVVYNAKMGNNDYAAHDLNADPKVVDDTLASFDGHLQSGSPAKDSGLAVGSLNGRVPSDDIEGKSRPAGSGVDRGAYEYGSSGGVLKPEIALNRKQLYFGVCPTGNTDAQTFQIENSGSGTLNWSAASDKSWLSVTPASGSGSGVVTVTVDGYHLPAGSYTGIITVSDSNASNSPQTVNIALTVYTSGGTTAPFGTFSTPVHGSTVSSSIPVTGWALDDVGIESVKIYRESGGELVYIGDALFVEGARPDVEQSYPTYPYNYRAGWGYMMLTNFLPGGGNGTFTLHAIAKDIEGHGVTLGTKTIVVDNAHAVKPFGAIDTPEQGGTASGESYRNHGWVLTPVPNTVPVDGSTIDVYVDGVYLGHPYYNIFREDVAALFPGYSNSSGAHGYFDLDTAGYENGVHTIYWAAEDNAGNADGIGSRYFIIQNSTPDQKFSGGPGTPRRGEPIKKLDGDIRIEIRELERVVIDLGMKDVIGHQVVGERLGRLPVGSTLDRERGIFYWNPGPGFLGDFRLVFSKKGEAAKKYVLIKIN